MSKTAGATNAGTVFGGSNEFHPGPSPIVAEEAELTWSALTEELARVSHNRCHKIQIELALAGDAATPGQLSGAIAHELNEPLGAIVINAQTVLRLLGVQPANTETIRRLLARIVEEGMRAGEIINRAAVVAESAPPRMQGLEISAAILEALGR